jgi:CHAT domain-containing protein
MIPSLLLTLSLLSDPELAVRQAAQDFVLRAHEGVVDDLHRVTDAEALEKKVRDTLRIRCIRVEGVVFERVEIASEKDVEKAVAEVEIATRKSEHETPDQWMPIETLPLRLRLRREGERWQVTSVEYPDEELARLLIEANDAPDEQQRLLRVHERRLTKNLVRIVDRQALAHVNSKDFAGAAPVGRLANRLATLAGDRAGEALSIGLACIVARLEKDRVRALRLGREALAVAEEAGDPDVLSRTWRTLGRVLEEDDSQSAENDDALRHGFAFALRSEDPLLIARAFHSMANAAFDKRDFFSARSYTEQSLPFVRASGDAGAEVTYELYLQSIYCSQGDRDLCQHHLQRLVPLVGDGWHLPYVLFDVGVLQTEDGRLEEARTTFNTALQKVSARTSEIVPGLIEQLAVVEAREGRIEEAECLLRQTEDLKRDLGLLHGPLFNLIMPEIVASGDQEKALRLSLEEAGRTQELLPDITMHVLMSAARGYRALGMRERALSTTREAIQLSEESMELNGGGQWQQVRSAAAVTECYELAADLALAGGDAKEALRLIERGRGQMLYAMIASGRPVAEEIGAGDRATRARLEQRLSQLNVELDRAEATVNRSEIDRLRAALLDAQQQHQSFIDGLSTIGERRMATLRPLQTTSLDEVLHQLPRDLALIEYVVRDDEVLAFVVRRTDSSSPIRSTYTIRIDRKALEGRVEKLVAMIANRDLRYPAAARELYALLVRPLERDLAGAVALCIVPDEALWRVPFAALMDDHGQFLIERTAIVHAASMTVYAAMAKRHEISHPSEHQVLALANPTLGLDVTKELNSYFRGTTFGALPDAEREVDAIRDIYGASNCVVLKRGEATETRAKEEMQGAHILHFATHGLLDDRNPLYSRLMFARDVEAGDDGSLEAWEIARLKIDADLVVLSACDTARGVIGGGEGVIGIAWSFFAAGARSTIATGWKIGSRSASDVMVGFHQALRTREGESLAKARALRDAQLQLIHSTNTRHPFYWAAFVLLGDGS